MEVIVIEVVNVYLVVVVIATMVILNMEVTSVEAETIDVIGYGGCVHDIMFMCVIEATDPNGIVTN